MSEIVDNEIRDKVMANILAKPQNQVCFDCGSKAPKWSSPYLGIVICYECSSKHRSYGTHISFVRSVDLDNWKRKELKSLELTGNSYTKERFNDLGVPMIGGNYDYNNSMVLKVRKEIEEMVKESLGPNEYKKTVEKKEEQNEIDNININEEEQKEDKKEKKKEKEEKKEDKEEEKEEKEEEKEEKEEDKDEDDSEKQRGIVIYDNVDYLFKFLLSSEEVKKNYVLVGYFYKILNHLFSAKSSVIVQYIFDYPKKKELDVLDLLVKNMNRKSMGEIISKLLLIIVI